MPFSTRPNLFSYDTPGSVTWLHRLDNWSGLGRGGAPGGGGGGGSCANGTLNAAGCTSKPGVAPKATDVRPAAAAPIAATAATPVASNFTVMAVPSIRTSISVSFCWSRRHLWRRRYGRVVSVVVS